MKILVIKSEISKYGFKTIAQLNCFKHLIYANVYRMCACVPKILLISPRFLNINNKTSFAYELTILFSPNCITPTVFGVYKFYSVHVTTALFVECVPSIVIMLMTTFLRKYKKNLFSVIW